MKHVELDAVNLHVREDGKTGKPDESPMRRDGGRASAEVHMAKIVTGKPDVR